MFARNQMNLFKSAFKNKFKYFDICRFRLTKQFAHFVKCHFQIFQNSNLLFNIFYGNECINYYILFAIFEIEWNFYGDDIV